jgi:hypothetical protein
VIRAYDQTPPAAWSIDLFGATVTHVGPGTSCGTPPPATPTAISVTYTGGGLDFDYTSVANATAYKIYRDRGVGCVPSSADYFNTDSNGPTYFDTFSLVEDEVYCYRVSAIGPGGESGLSNTVYGTYDTGSPQCSDGIDNDSNDKTDYPDDPGCKSSDDDDESSPIVTQCSNGIDDDKDGKVDLVDPGCTSSSDDDEFDFLTEAPNLYVASECTGGSITVDWNSQPSVGQYRIYRCSGASCSPTIQVALTTSSPYKDSGLTFDPVTGTTYRYRVRGFNGGLFGPYSNIASSICYPNPPTNLSISASPTIVRKGNSTVLSWSSTGAESCTVSSSAGTLITGSCASNPQACNGSDAVTITSEVVYTLECSNIGGNAKTDVRVRVLPEYDEQ